MLHRLAAILLSAIVASGSSLPQSRDVACSACPNIELSAEGGMAFEYSRYMGVWQEIGTWEGRPYYMCLDDCQQLQSQLVSDIKF